MPNGGVTKRQDSKTLQKRKPKMKTNYFSRKLILSLAASIALAASPALAHPWHGAHSRLARPSWRWIRVGTGWPRYRGRVNRRRTRLSLLRPARVLGAIR